MVLPTTGTIYTHDAVAADPVQLNTNLGYYTNFVNLLDLAAVAVPAGFRGNGLPFGISVDWREASEFNDPNGRPAFLRDGNDCIDRRAASASQRQKTARCSCFPGHYVVEQLLAHVHSAFHFPECRRDSARTSGMPARTNWLGHVIGCFRRFNGGRAT